MAQVMSVSMRELVRLAVTSGGAGKSASSVSRGPASGLESGWAFASLTPSSSSMRWECSAQKGSKLLSDRSAPGGAGMRWRIGPWPSPLRQEMQQ